MATKGPSNHYGYANGGRQGSASEHIGYAWAKDFNKRSLNRHFDDHAKQMGFTSKESYKQHALRFANNVDRKNHESFIDKKTNKTYKYSVKTNEFVITPFGENAGKSTTYLCNTVSATSDYLRDLFDSEVNDVFKNIFLIEGVDKDFI